jgi:uncharacterized protein (DUF362 family)
MTFTRRAFVRTSASAAGAALWSIGRLGGQSVAPERAPQSYFGLHPDIENNPNAVFIRRTHVPDKLAADAKRNEGLALAREIFVPMDHPGIPISHRIVLKPNATGLVGAPQPEDVLGVGTDPQFYEGLVLGLKELGLSKFNFVDSTEYPSWNVRGFNDINERLGVAINNSQTRPRQLREGDGVTWTRVPDGVVFKRIPHYAPVNEPETWLLNIAKWKAHAMGLTQSVKNEQGLVARPFTRFCSDWAGVLGVPDYMKPDINPDAERYIKDFFERHNKRGYARYDSKGVNAIKPITQEIWAHKTCDNQSTLNTGLAIIEGIYGRDGDGFWVGKDYLTNMVLFGKQQFRLDVIGLYLGGHEPGNINLYRIAKERGLTDTFNPWEIPVFEWIGGRAVPRKLTDFQRTPLLTIFLPRDKEPRLHLVNEPFDYERNKT